MLTSLFFLSLLSLLVSLAGSLRTTLIDRRVHVVSILDSSSVSSAILKTHSLLRSASRPQEIALHFLVIEDERLSLQQWKEAFLSCFPQYRQREGEIERHNDSDTHSHTHTQTHALFESVSWSRPAALRVLRNEKFERDAIFARFYLPVIFPGLSRFLYLDNDVVLNADVADLYFRDISISFALPEGHTSAHAHTSQHTRGSTISSASSSPPHQYTARFNHVRTTTNNNNNNNNNNNYNYNNINSNHIKSTDYTDIRSTSNGFNIKHTRSSPAAVAMVYETHPFYRTYLRAHFNTSHALFAETKTRLGRDDLFLNAGVFLVDTAVWRRENLTLRAEQLILENAKSFIYDTSVGDQGPFYLLLQDRVSFLPPEYNMRRLPKKTMSMLEEGARGIVHFAGITKGEGLYLCRYPLQFPILFPAALPLFFSTLHSLNKSCPSFLPRYEPPQSQGECLAAMRALLGEIDKEKIAVRFHPGVAGFVWPPEGLTVS